MIGFDNIDYASLTDVGVRRSHNQDNHAILLAMEEERWLQQGHVFMVADGMGGHAVGELASEIAVGNIPHIYQKHIGQGPIAALRRAFEETNATINGKGKQNREFEGLGTTATAMVVRPEGAWFGHVGDSRGYRVRQGKIEQLTFDHSLVWEIARKLKIEPEAVDGPSNVLIRSMGPTEQVQVDIEGPHPLLPGDIFLLCSDGLSGQISDAELGAVTTALSPAEACRFLIDLANLRGGPDNITVIIVRVGKAKAGESPAGGDPKQQAAGPRWQWKLPIAWPIVALGVGTLLAAVAMLLTLQKSWIGIPAFLFAVPTLATGLIGLIILHLREQTEAQTPKDEPPPLRVHRTLPCPIDKPLVDKIARANHALKARAQEKHWQPDWPTFQSMLQKAEQFLAKKEYVPAFREYCRALKTLMDSSNKLRQKDDMFQPVWEK